MALYEVMILALLVAAFAFAMGSLTTRRGTVSNDRTTALEDELNDLHLKSVSRYREGFEDAKHLYYTSLIADRIAEDDRQKREREAEYKAMATENLKYCPISSDLLMAYGVTTIGQLPKSLRDAYNVTDDMNTLDLDTIIHRETGGYLDGTV